MKLSKKLLYLIISYFNKSKKKKEIKKLESKLKLIYKNLEIRRGPFEGLYYPDFISTGSTLFPKLAGVYERELNHIIEKILQGNYEYFIDVGCAEGYYAAGMAKFGNFEKVIAYDIDHNARNLCKKIGKVNNVILDIRKELTIEELKKIPFLKSKKSVIMVDCEGFERYLFTQEVMFNLVNVECLIEIHDWCQEEERTKDLLLKLFNQTHQCILINGIDDYDKAYNYYLEELSGFTVKERLHIFAEGRKRLGVWLYCIPKQDSCK